MDDIQVVLLAHGFCIQRVGKGFMCEHRPWFCILGENLNDHGDTWVLHNLGDEHFGGTSAFDLAALLYKFKVPLVDGPLLMTVARKNHWGETRH